MAIQYKKRFVEVLSPQLKYSGKHAGQKLTFSEILHHMDKQEFNDGEKIRELSILKTDLKDCILGIVISNQDKEIAPIRNKSTKEYRQVQIDTSTEGMAYANIFLYNSALNILLYEVNRNGCFLDQLKSLLYRRTNSIKNARPLDIKFLPVARKEEYERMLRIHYYKNIRLELLNPHELIDLFEEENESIIGNLLRKNLEASDKNNANVLVLEHAAISKKVNPTGLSSSLVQKIVDSLKKRLPNVAFKKHVKKLEVKGYSMDVENPNRISTVDLLTDVFNEYFNIQRIRVHSDVQQSERKAGLEALYNKILPELEQIVGKSS